MFLACYLVGLFDSVLLAFCLCVAGGFWLFVTLFGCLAFVWFGGSWFALRCVEFGVYGCDSVSVCFLEFLLGFSGLVIMILL